MCNLTQGLDVVSNALTTYANMKAAKNQAEYEAKVDEQNKSIALQQEMATGQQGAMQQSQIRQQAKQVTGAQKTGYAASGLDIQAGSPLAAISDTAYKSGQDVATSRYNTALNMWGLQQQANEYQDQANSARIAGKNKSTSALLTGLNTAAQQYSGFSNIKTPSTTKKSSPLFTNSQGKYLISDSDYTFENPANKYYKTKKYF